MGENGIFKKRKNKKIKRQGFNITKENMTIQKVCSSNSYELQTKDQGETGCIQTRSIERIKEDFAKRDDSQRGVAVVNFLSTVCQNRMKKNRKEPSVRSQT